MTVCFTGHRPKNLPYGSNENDIRCIALKEKLTEEITKQIACGADTFICGMAQGVDMLAAEIVLNCKTEHPKICLIAAIPCLNQNQSWHKKEIKRYMDILDKCDEKIVLSPIYFHGCMQVRNRYMVDRSDSVIAVYNGSPSGGTASTVRYAMKQNKNLIIIRP